MEKKISKLLKKQGTAPMWEKGPEKAVPQSGGAWSRVGAAQPGVPWPDTHQHIDLHEMVSGSMHKRWTSRCRATHQRQKINRKLLLLSFILKESIFQGSDVFLSAWGAKTYYWWRKVNPCNTQFLQTFQLFSQTGLMKYTKTFTILA